MATTFTPEPCTACDNGQPCETHGTASTWGDDWLHPRERKFAVPAS